MRVHQSLQGQVGGYASLVVLTPSGQRLELKYLEDATAWRQEMFKRIGAADAPPDRAAWQPEAP